MSIYSLHVDDGYVHEDRYIPSNILPTLAPAIGANQHQQWVEKLAELLSCERPDLQVVVGTTGGLRKALSEGNVTEAQVEAFSQALEAAFSCEQGGSRARLAQFSGSEEAELELAAVRYIAKNALLPVRPNFGGGLQVIEDEVGVLSCGGASSQIAYHPHLQEVTMDNSILNPASPNFLSLNTDLLGAIELARKYGHQTWTGAAFAYTEDLMWKRIAEAGAPLGKLRGTFIVIELAGSIGKEAGLADRLVPKREAVQLLTQHLESMQRLAGKDLKIKMGEDPNNNRTPESVSFFQQARIPLVIITLALLDLFSSRAWFFFGTSFTTGTADNLLRTQWPLGLFLKESQLLNAMDKKKSKDDSLFIKEPTLIPAAARSKM
jgi:hypothetical protein